MVDFLTAAEAEAAQLRADAAATMAQLQALYGYFGEAYDGNDPVRILSTVAAFIDTFSKTIDAMEVRARGGRTACCCSAKPLEGRALRCCIAKRG